MPIKNSAIIAVIAVLAAGLGAYFFVKPATAPKIIAFVEHAQTLQTDSDALTQPEEGADLAAKLPKGLEVRVHGVIDGAKWAQVTLPDGRDAFVSTQALGNLGAPQPSTAIPPTLFHPTSDVYNATREAIVYLEPNVQAPQKYKIPAGTAIPALSLSNDAIWVRASTEDGEPAYLLTSDLGPPHHGKAVTADPTGASPAAALPDIVDGPATVTTTAQIQVGGQTVTLAGIVGEGGAYAQQLQSIIDSQGRDLHCVRQDQGYLCKLPSNIDIALSALYLGGARPAADAPDAYVKQADAAQAAGRGQWHP